MCAESDQRKRVSIVTPFYNEEANVGLYFDRLLSVLESLKAEFEFEFVCVNDGSRDRTLSKLRDTRLAFGEIRLVDLSRNFGKEAALSAGLDHATGDAVIPVDADLQDPPEVIPELIREWQAGAPVVLAVRQDRHSDGLLKRFTAAAFYDLHNRLASTSIPANVGDFRLLDRVVVDVVRSLPERQRFMKGLFAWAGFPAVQVPYVRPARAAGSSKWTYWRLLNLAIEGITSFSTAPLRASTLFGVVFSIVAMIYGGVIAARALWFGSDVPGYASIFVAVVFMGGIQLLSIGILGEYVGRIYMESKQRPVYIVQRLFNQAATSARSEDANANSTREPAAPPR